MPSGLWYLDFDGGDDRVTITGNSDVRLATPFTVMAWASSGDINQSAGVVTQGNIGTDGYQLYNHSTTSWRFLSGSGTAVAGPAPVLDRWTFLVATDNGTTSILYVDGATSWNEVSSDVQDANADFWVGDLATTPDWEFEGSIALVRLSNAVLTPAQISSIYNQERALFGV